MIEEKEDLSDLLNHPGDEVTLGEEFTFVQKYLTAYKNEMLQASGQTDARRNEKIDFIGAQPVSMRLSHITSHIKENIQDEYSYLICEKTDGVRYIMVLTTTGECFLTGRNTSANSQNPYKLQKVKMQLNNQLFSNEDDEEDEQGAEQLDLLEVFDGELVLDYKNGQYFLKYLIFDCIVHFGEKIFDKTYYDRLRSALYFTSYNKMCYEISQEPPPANIPFDSSLGKALIKQRAFGEHCDFNEDEDEDSTITIGLQVKDFFKYKHAGYLFENYIPALPHHNDGIIFTKNISAYKPGTDSNIIKWKPPTMNTIDFLLVANTDSILDGLADADDLENKVIDLYVMEQSKERNSYEVSFFDFMIVDESFFQEILDKTQERQGALGIVAECKWTELEEEKKPFLKKIYSADTDTILTLPENKTDHNQEGTRKWVAGLRAKYRQAGFAKGWAYERYRLDKTNSNNIQIAKDIVASIEENLDQNKLVQMLLQNNNNGQPYQQPQQLKSVVETQPIKKQKKN